MVDGQTEGVPGQDYESRYRENAAQILTSLGLKEAENIRVRPASGHHSSIVVACDSASQHQYLLKYFIPPEEGHYYPAGVRLDDYARRECAFYRYLDSVDPERRMMPAPQTIVLDSADPPNWILLERIDSAIGPDEEVMGSDHIFELLRMLQSIPVDQLLGRRNFPLNRWDTFSHLDRVRKMYDPVLQVIGEKRWTQTSEFFDEALRWTETRQQTIVHGDFTANNILVNGDDKPYLIDFGRIGIGNEDHDFAWFWIHSDRSQEWKQNLLARFFETRMGSERIRSEWGIRSAIVYLALRRLRFSLLILGDEDPNRAQNLGLLDAALMGSHDLFPV